MDHIVARLNTVVTFANLLTAQQNVQGFLVPAEGYALYLVAGMGPGTGEIVEIGSFMGKSTFWLARGSMDMSRERVTAVDHFVGSPEHVDGGPCHSDVLEAEGTTYNAFLKNMEDTGVASHVDPIKASSEEAVRTWTRPIRLLFIDGDHSYAGVKQDFEMWFPYICPGGIVAFHDYKEWDGVTQFVDEVLGRRDVTPFLGIQSLMCVRRVAT